MLHSSISHKNQGDGNFDSCKFHIIQLKKLFGTPRFLIFRILMKLNEEDKLTLQLELYFFIRLQI